MRTHIENIIFILLEKLAKKETDGQYIYQAQAWGNTSEKLCNLDHSYEDNLSSNFLALKVFFVQ